MSNEDQKIVEVAKANLPEAGGIAFTERSLYYKGLGVKLTERRLTGLEAARALAETIDTLRGEGWTVNPENLPESLPVPYDAVDEAFPPRQQVSPQPTSRPAPQTDAPEGVEKDDRGNWAGRTFEEYIGKIKFEMKGDKVNASFYPYLGNGDRLGQYPVAKSHLFDPEDWAKSLKHKFPEKVIKISDSEFVKVSQLDDNIRNFIGTEILFNRGESVATFTVSERRARNGQGNFYVDFKALKNA